MKRGDGQAGAARSRVGVVRAEVGELDGHAQVEQQPEPRRRRRHFSGAARFDLQGRLGGLEGGPH
eukprot:464296-Pyramimonas_sp.AAC.1